MSDQRKSVYTLGAEDGLILGPVMAAAIVLCGASLYIAWTSLPAIAAFIAVPVIAYIRLARAQRVQPSTFSGIWLQGICMFFFGGLIASVVAFASLRWWAPGFLGQMLDSAIAVYGQINNADVARMVDTLNKIKEMHALPSPLDVALELLYFAVFTGSILSMVYALIIRNLFKRKTL